MQKIKLIGKVNWYNSSKGYGFIMASGYDPILAPQRAINITVSKTLTRGQSVYFELLNDKHGLRASNIRVF